MFKIAPLMALTNPIFTWVLIGHAMEDIAVLMWASWFDSDLQLCLLLQHFSAIALLALILVINDDTLSFAVATSLLALLIHTGA